VQQVVLHIFKKFTLCNKNSCKFYSLRPGILQPGCRSIYFARGRASRDLGFLRKASLSGKPSLFSDTFLLPFGNIFQLPVLLTMTKGGLLPDLGVLSLLNKTNSLLRLHPMVQGFTQVKPFSAPGPGE
jgi:hypothetical protein